MVLKRMSLPVAPVVLGMVLGGIMEVKLRFALAQVKTPLDFIDRPIAAIIFGLVAVMCPLYSFLLQAFETIRF